MQELFWKKTQEAASALLAQLKFWQAFPVNEDGPSQIEISGLRKYLIAERANF